MNKEYRIKKSEEIEKIIKNKHSVGNKHYIIYIMENSEASHFRLGMSVSKKIGNAVIRNQEKRRIREIFSKYKDNLKNYDIFIISRKESLSIDFLEKEKSINYLLRKLNIFQKEEK